MPALVASLSTDSSVLTTLFRTTLDISLTGFILFRPLYAEGQHDEIIDLAYVYLNPAAQQQLRLPECPADSFLTLYPHAMQAGIFAFYRDIFLASESGRYEVNYQHDGLDNYFLLSAQRSGDLLLVSFTDTADQPRTAVENALRTSQAREQAAHTETEAQRQQLYQTFQEAPAMICVFDGPQHVFQFVNPPYQALVGDRPLVGKPIAEAMPELAGQPIFDLLDAVYRTGETFQASEMLVQLDHDNTQPQKLESRYYNFIYKARHATAGHIDGIFVFAYDVTTQVLARQQVQRLNEELAAINEELRASNEELLLANTALSHAQQQLQERTREAQVAQAEAEVQRAALQRVFEQAPVAISMLHGPTHVVEFANSKMGQIWGRPLAQVVGQPHFEALPDLAGQGFEAVFDGVLRTGEPRYFQELPVTVRQNGQLYRGYFNIVYQPAYDGAGYITGILASALEVSEQVLARQQVQRLNEELAAINEELKASNEEFLANNVELTLAQQQLRQLNQELEGRVLARTQEVEAARTAAERQRQRLEDLFMSAPAAICIFDGPDWVYQLVNPGYQQLFPGRQLLGRPLLEALPEVADTPLVDILRAVYNTGIPFEGKEVLVPIARTEGGPVEDAFFDLTYQARYSEHGQIDGFITYANDVTEQVLARRERAAQDRRLSELFEQAPVAIAVFRGPSYVLDVVNSSMAAMWNRAPKDLMGWPFFTVLPELEGQGLRELLDEVRTEGVAYTAYEQAVQLAHHHPGEVGYFSYVYQPLREAPGQPAAIACVAIEVTAQVVARQQVQRLNEELAAINEEMQASNEELSETNQQLTRTNVDLDNFIYTASHDLKQPIANIEGLLLALTHQLPAETQQDELVAPILERMQGAVDRFKRTIADLTEVSKLQQSYAQPAQTVDLAQLVTEVRLDLAPVLLETQGQLEVDVAGCPAVTFSEKNMRSVIYNLLSNALKYRAPDRPLRVHISCVQVGQQVQLRVQDNGLGLDERQQSRLFGLFQRLHTHVEGTGIGLYMVKKMVENARGTITVQSQLGVGSTFTVSLPI